MDAKDAMDRHRGGSSASFGMAHVGAVTGFWVEISRHVTLKRVVVDMYCKIPDGFTAGVDLALDQQRFHVTERGITSITPEMLGQAVRQVR